MRSESTRLPCHPTGHVPSEACSLRPSGGRGTPGVHLPSRCGSRSRSDVCHVILKVIYPLKPVSCDPLRHLLNHCRSRCRSEVCAFHLILKVMYPPKPVSCDPLVTSPVTVAEGGRPSMWSWRSRILALKPVLCDPLVTSPVAAAPGRGSESTRLPWNRRLVPVSHKNRVPTRLDRWVLSRSPDKDRCSTTRLCTTLN